MEKKMEGMFRHPWGKGRWKAKRLEGFLNSEGALDRLRHEEELWFLASGLPPGGHPDARYSFMGWKPWQKVIFKKNNFSSIGLYSCEERDCVSFLSSLSLNVSPSAPPFPFCFFTAGYGLRNCFETLPDRHEDSWPLFHIIFPTLILCWDRKEEETHLISFTPEESLDPEENLKVGLESLSDLLEEYFLEFDDEIPSQWRCLKEEEFVGIVEKALVLIERGDIYQANLSLQASASFKGDALSLFKTLYAVNPAPFACFVKTKEWQLMSSSPERLFCVQGEKILTRPIAGTRRRGRNEEEDVKMIKELQTDAKEMAEHIMLVDLERNDLGRICEIGSVRVSPQGMIESYSHVHHLVSRVQGSYRKGINFFDVLRALFPGGTITGCPKIRSMQVIDELEPVARGLYTGGVGYLDISGGGDMNILIRSFVLSQGTLYAQAGAGIVADSIPRREYRECLSKLAALFEACAKKKNFYPSFNSREGK